jgi:hypothetical protein
MVEFQTSIPAPAIIDAKKEVSYSFIVEEFAV